MNTYEDSRVRSGSWEFATRRGLIKLGTVNVSHEGAGWAMIRCFEDLYLMRLKKQVITHLMDLPKPAVRNSTCEFILMIYTLYLLSPFSFFPSPP